MAMNTPRPSSMAVTSAMTFRRGGGGNLPSLLFRSFVLLCVGSILYSIHIQQISTNSSSSSSSRSLLFVIDDSNVKQQPQQQDDDDQDRPTTMQSLHQQREEERNPHQQQQQQQILSMMTAEAVSLINPQGIPEIQFFNDTAAAITKTSNSPAATSASDNQIRGGRGGGGKGGAGSGGMNGCLINLDDTIRLAEWIPYHYTLLPLKSLIIAFDPNTTAKSINRTLQLVDLWKDKIDFTVWPDFVLPSHKIKINHKQPKRSVPYVRQRQVYFAKQCLIRHKQRQLHDLQLPLQQKNQTTTTSSRSSSSSWTLLTDNDEYLTYNYIHSEEEDPSQYFPKKEIFKKRALKERKKYYEPIRKKQLPDWFSSKSDNNNNNDDDNNNNSSSSTTPPPPPMTTIIEFLDHHQDKFRKCIRLPSIRYGPGNETSSLAANTTDISGIGADSQEQYYPPVVDDLTVLSTIQGVYHTKRLGKGSKVMIDLSRVDMEDLHGSSGKTIHNPNQRVCGYNGANDSGTDYVGAVFRLQHYLGSVESFLERKADYRTRSLDKYYDMAKEVSRSSMKDHDIVPWLNSFVAKVGLSNAKELLRPLEEFSKQERQQQEQYSLQQDDLEQLKE